jgi:hypothetical protein
MKELRNAKLSMVDDGLRRTRVRHHDSAESLDPRRPDDRAG